MSGKESIIQSLNWDKTPLIPTIAQDFQNKEVLMLGFSSKDSLCLSFESGLAHYFSRSKNRIWKKGEQSGHLQHIKQVLVDCDNDTLIFLVSQEGVACHNGTRSCFRPLDCEISSLPSEIDTCAIYGIIDTLYHTLLLRKNAKSDTSYTASLYAKGTNTIAKKIIEEAGELTFALKDGSKEDIIYECADLVYHTLVGLAFNDISPDEVRQELLRREGLSGLEEKRLR